MLGAFSKTLKCFFIFRLYEKSESFFFSLGKPCLLTAPKYDVINGTLSSDYFSIDIFFLFSKKRKTTNKKTAIYRHDGERGFAKCHSW